MFTVNSETGSYPAYCMEPHKSSPSGPATVSILDNDTIKALLLCAYEGPYPMLSPDALVELGVPLEEAKKSIYCITHGEHFEKVTRKLDRAQKETLVKNVIKSAGIPVLKR